MKNPNLNNTLETLIAAVGGLSGLDVVAGNLQRVLAHKDGKAAALQQLKELLEDEQGQYMAFAVMGLAAVGVATAKKYHMTTGRAQRQ